MFDPVSEQEFLARKHTPINHIGIYELDWILDYNQLDCEGIMVAFEDKQFNFDFEQFTNGLDIAA